MDSHENRRVHQRLQVPQVLVKISSPERMRVDYLHDLSKGGLFIKTNKPLALDRLIDVDLLPPGQESAIRVRCKVVRVRDDEEAKRSNSQGMGLKFVDLAPEMMIALDAILEEYQRNPEPGPPQPVVPRAETRLLEQALDEIAALTATLADRDRALAGARQHQEQLEERVLAERAPSEDLHAQLLAAQAEVGSLQTQLSEARGDTEAYGHEVQSARAELALVQTQLAETLSDAGASHQELQASRAKVEGLQAQLSEALGEVGATRQELRNAKDEADGLHTQLSEALGNTEAYRHELEAALAQQKLELDAAWADRLVERMKEVEGMQTQLSEALGNAEAYRHELSLVQDDAPRRLEDALAHQRHELDTAYDAQLAEAREELEAERGRRLEAERKESDLAGARLQLTERIAELEAQVGMGQAQASTAAELAAQLEAARALIAVLQEGAPAPAAAAPAGVRGSSGSTEFLARLRNNDPLFKLERFHSFTPTSQRDTEVMGLLEGADCYKDLCVLGRSIVTPDELEQVLASFHQLTLIAFER